MHFESGNDRVESFGSSFWKRGNFVFIRPTGKPGVIRRKPRMPYHPYVFGIPRIRFVFLDYGTLTREEGRREPTQRIRKSGTVYGWW